MSEDLQTNVFISWSGTQAGEVAKVLHNWIEVALQFTKPFLSKKIGAGKRWSSELAKALSISNFGILILTKENIHSDWMLFEAGALAKHLGHERVIPCLIDLDPGDIDSPLSDFQAVKLPDDFLSVVKALNEVQPDPWDGSRLQKTYDSFKHRFIKDYNNALRETVLVNKDVKPRSDKDKLEEILQIVRGISSPIQEEKYGGHSEPFYPTDDRVLLYKFLKSKVTLPLYRYASMPALFEGAAKFVKYIKPNLSEDEALLDVARYLISERPLRSLLDALKKYEREDT